MNCTTCGLVHRACMCPRELTALQLAVREVDEAEARWLHQHRRFDAERQELVLREWPVGTRVRWKQTPWRDVFEAEGVVTRFVTEAGEHPDVICAGYSWLNRDAWVTIRFTKHPGLPRRLPFEGPMLHNVMTDELERLP